MRREEAGPGRYGRPKGRRRIGHWTLRARQHGSSSAGVHSAASATTASTLNPALRDAACVQGRMVAVPLDYPHRPGGDDRPRPGRGPGRKLGHPSQAPARHAALRVTEAGGRAESRTQQVPFARSSRSCIRSKYLPNRRSSHSSLPHLNLPSWGNRLLGATTAARVTLQTARYTQVHRGVRETRRPLTVPHPGRGQGAVTVRPCVCRSRATAGDEPRATDCRLREQLPIRLLDLRGERRQRIRDPASEVAHDVGTIGCQVVALRRVEGHVVELGGLEHDVVLVRVA